MATPLSRANFADLLDPAFRKVYTDAEKELPYIYSQVFNVMNSSKNLEKDTSISGLGTLVEKSEGGTSPKILCIKDTMSL
jgi:hypothetical protein